MEEQFRGSVVGCIFYVIACCRGGRAIITKFVIKIDMTALEFCKPVINSCLAWCFIGKRSLKPSEALLSCQIILKIVDNIKEKWTIGITIESGTDRRNENGARIRIESGTGTDIENRTSRSLLSTILNQRHTVGRFLGSNCHGSPAVTKLSLVTGAGARRTCSNDPERKYVKHYPGLSFRMLVRGAE
ncbi:hypothetical protein EVAR_435_1 [Eumeta japonica]|uniref:Uncharacterized protein n=1 Tax=Eumeta variegata TaxID=151549 RepID=A0A4C1SDC6_EUMVA|nr:hypothetical protein EVAR_435_1 [Eumeta japonica]